MERALQRGLFDEMIIDNFAGDVMLIDKIDKKLLETTFGIRFGTF